MNNDKPKIFISYSSADSDFAELMKMKLEGSDIIVWRDIHEIAAGEEWRNEIDFGLLSSDILIVLLTKNSAKSSYVTYEWAWALGNGKNIIPILIEPCEIHPRIKVLQYLDFQNRKRPWNTLIERVTALHAKKSNSTSGEGQLSMEAIFNGIKALANANAKQSSRTTNANDVAQATDQMVSARNYLNTVSKKSNTILWVDDNPDNNKYEREAFEALGFQFNLALSTNEALELLKSNTYAAVLSDMGRVEGPQEGYVLLKQIRQSDKETPFIIYASSNLLEHKIMAQERGAQGSTNRADELIDLVTTHVGNIPKNIF
ncbi:TIR domain-containing protein [Kriegella aquimaris]|uniref:Response regulator receiver domain-containing protein n=1 Tax=Kriegella aquimaris TaxID=192904 RepID=A0A1G9YED4_9FLAO|nr:TIR domain-containing protein [Kriegella aquimaris]SDN07422.1 Response regulator receiver domain-containing protein [Kriegella aquimaris]